MKRVLCKPIAHIETGKQRRDLYPKEKPLSLGAADVLERSPDITLQREFSTLKDGTQLFYQVMWPKDRPPQRLLVFFHGITSQSDLYVEFCAHFVREGAVVLLLDLPAHGRSDGLLVYIRDWWALTQQLWEFIATMVPRLRQEIAALPGAPAAVSVFGTGVSLGGGLMACLAIQMPKFFDGLVLFGPLVGIADELKPAPLVMFIFKNFLVPLLPTWPITPSKDLSGLDFRDPKYGDAYDQVGNPLSMKGLKMRLGTSASCVLVFTEWLTGQFGNLTTPFLVLHGQDDFICDPNMSQRLYDEAAAKDKNLLLIPDAYHCELFCCLPGNARSIGLDWAPEMVEVTSRCLREAAAWMAERSKT